MVPLRAVACTPPSLPPLARARAAGSAGFAAVTGPPYWPHPLNPAQRLGAPPRVLNAQTGPGVPPNGFTAITCQ